MSRPKVPQRSGGLKLLLAPLKGHGPLLFSLAVLVAVMAFGTLWVWEAVRPRVVDAPQYQLDPSHITVNPPTAWTTTKDVTAEVIRDASLDGPLSIMDDKLTERIALAFAGHPWVEKVERVEKFHPARVVVRVVYREPVAAVAVGKELWPVDRGAVLLPREHFSRLELERLPRIAGIATGPGMRAGNPWQDPRVQGGALVADAVADLWQALDLSSIVPSARPVGPSGTYHFELLTRNGQRITWGRQPLADDPSEPSPLEKLKRLRTYVEQQSGKPSVSQSGKSPAPRTAKDATDEVLK